MTERLQMLLELGETDREVVFPEDVRSDVVLQMAMLLLAQMNAVEAIPGARDDG